MDLILRSDRTVAGVIASVVGGIYHLRTSYRDIKSFKTNIGAKITEIFDATGHSICCITKCGDLYLYSKPIDFIAKTQTSFNLSVEECIQRYELSPSKLPHFGPLKVVETIIKCDKMYYCRGIGLCAFSYKKLMLHVLFKRILPWITYAVMFSKILMRIIRYLISIWHNRRISYKF